MLTGAEIKAIRDRLGESQTVFAARFGVDQSVISRWENEGVPDRGTTRIAIETVLAKIPAPADADLKAQTAQAE